METIVVFRDLDNSCNRFMAEVGVIMVLGKALIRFSVLEGFNFPIWAAGGP